MCDKCGKPVRFLTIGLVMEVVADGGDVEDSRNCLQSQVPEVLVYDVVRMMNGVLVLTYQSCLGSGWCAQESACVCGRNEKSVRARNFHCLDTKAADEK